MRGCGGQRVMMVDSTQKTNEGLQWIVYKEVDCGGQYIMMVCGRCT